MSILIEEIITQGSLGTSSELQGIVLRLPSWSSEYNEDGVNIRRYHLTYSGTEYVKSNVRDWPDEISGRYIRCPDVTLTPDNPIVILVRNRPVWESTYGTSQGVEVVDWRFLKGHGDDSYWIAKDIKLNPAGDVLQLKDQWSGSSTRLFDMVAWGDSSLFEFYKANDEVERYNRGFWDTPNTAPVAGHGRSIKRLNGRDTNKSSDWVVLSNPIPGQTPWGGVGVWASIQLPEFVISPTYPMTPSSPGAGEWLPVGDAAPLDPSGTIQLDVEQIYYTETSADAIKIGGRGANGTAPASHPTTSKIRLIDPATGESHRRYSIDRLELKRRAVYQGDKLIVPEALSVWGSALNSPQMPEFVEGEDKNSDHKIDWIGEAALYHVTNPQHDTTINVPLLGRRLRHLMIRFGPMSDGGRAKLNDIYVWMRSGVVERENFRGMAGIFHDLLTNVLSQDELSIIDLDNLSADKLVSNASLGQVINDLLAENGLMMRYRRDGKVTIERHPSHPLAIMTGPVVPTRETPVEPTTNYDVTALLDVRAIRSPHQTKYVSRIGAPQIVAEIFDPVSEEYYQATYPPNLHHASVKRVNLRFAVRNSSEAAMIAQMIYNKEESIKRTYTGTTVGPIPSLKVGDLVLVRDVSDEATHGGRLFPARIRAITHGGEAGNESLELIEWR